MNDNTILFAFLVPLLLVMIAFAILMFAAQWKIYVKAGQEGWKALIPIYNIYILLKIVGKPGWWLILMLIPLVNAIYVVWTYNMLSKSFGKDEGFTVGLVLAGVIFFPILGFGSAVYQGPYGDKSAFEAHQAAQLSFDAENI